MPSLATISSFYVFTPSTKARASQVNHNFDLFRGHFLPIDPTAQTASDQTYDLGVSDYRWRMTYCQKYDTSISLGASDVFSAASDGTFSWAKSGSTIGSFSPTLFKGQNAKPMDPTTTAGYGGLAASGSINGTVTADGFLVNSTCTISTNGRPTWIGLQMVDGTTAACEVAIEPNTTLPSAISNFNLIWYYEGGSTELAISKLGAGYTTGIVGSTPSGKRFSYPPNSLGHIFPLAAGTHTIQLWVDTTATSLAQFNLVFKNVRVIAFEL
jgi:hypothetical protein